MEDFKFFLYPRFVTPNRSCEVKHIQILRDIVVSETLLLENVCLCLLLVGQFLQGVELGIIAILLHKIYLKSYLITGPLIVGVRPTIPVQGVSSLLSIDLAGSIVVLDPIICEKIITNVTSDDGDDEVYPACSTAPSMTRRSEVEVDTVEALNTACLSSEIDLSDTFLFDLHCSL